MRCVSVRLRPGDLDFIGLDRENIWDFPKIRGALSWGPYNKDPAIKGAIFWSPIFGNPHFFGLEAFVLGIGKLW